MGKQYEELVHQALVIENKKRGLRIQAIRHLMANTQPTPTVKKAYDRLEKELVRAIRVNEEIDDALDHLETMISSLYQA